MLTSFFLSEKSSSSQSACTSSAPTTFNPFSFYFISFFILKLLGFRYHFPYVLIRSLFSAGFRSRNIDLCSPFTDSPSLPSICCELFTINLSSRVYQSSAIIIPNYSRVLPLGGTPSSSHLILSSRVSFTPVVVTPPLFLFGVTEL